jgi:hypothetical protein
MGVPGDVVQITDESLPWFPAFVLVTEEKSFGIQGCVFIPQGNEECNHCQQAFIRLRREQYEVIGEAVITLGEKE